MGFENPAYLWGGLAAIIPLLLHLIMRRRAKVHEFAAVEFILLSNKKIARRLKLRQYLLLLMRMLLIAALPIAFAKPYLTQDQAAPAYAAGTEPVSLVLIVDPSFSMRYRLEQDETLLDRAKERARAIVDDLRPESDAAIVVAGSPPRALTPRLTYERAELKEAIDSIVPGDGTADMQGALRLAEQILVAAGQPQREVVLLTDLQATEWEGITRPWSLEHSPGVTVVDLRDGRELGNVAITSVVAEPAAGALGREIRVLVEVLNDQPHTFEDVITVKVAGKTAKGILKVPPRQRAEKSFSVRLSEVETVSGTVELPPDALPGDNVRPFVIDFLRRVHVLVVNGSPRTVPHRDETFFLRAALRPARDSGSRISPTYVKPDELTAAQLEYVDVVVLANVAELEPNQVSALVEFVHKGGGVFVSAGENITPQAYNGPMSPLAPLPVRDIKDAGVTPLFFTGVETAHPMLAVFASLPDASLFTAKTSRYVLLDTEARGDTRVLVSFTDGAPALVERTVGQGRIVMLTTTLDRDWTELPFKTSYLPLMQQIILQLGGRLQAEESRSLVVGDPYSIRVGRDVSAVEVVRPDGHTRTFGADDLGVGRVRFHDTQRAGVYTVRQKRGQAGTEERFAVHVDARESSLAGAEQSNIEVILAGGQGSVDESGGAVRKAVRTPGRSGNVWPLILLSLFVLLGLETWLAIQR